MGHGHAVQAPTSRAACWRGGCPRNVLVNVNFPDVAAGAVKGMRVTRQGVRAFGGGIVERTDPRGGTYYWIAYAPGEHDRDEESDITAVRGATSRSRRSIST